MEAGSTNLTWLDIHFRYTGLVEKQQRCIAVLECYVKPLLASGWWFQSTIYTTCAAVATDSRKKYRLSILQLLQHIHYALPSGCSPSRQVGSRHALGRAYMVKLCTRADMTKEQGTSHIKHTQTTNTIG